MEWLTAVGLGACGGAVVQLVSFYAKLQAWQAARGKARAARRHTLPLLTSYIDLLAEILVLVTRLGLGALAGLIFHTQIDGVTAAIAVGAAAPALLSQLGTARGIVALDVGDGTDIHEPASKVMTDLDPLAKEG